MGADDESRERASEIACPRCREDEELSGRPDGDLILIDCLACGASWHRDPERRCPRCGAGDLYPAPVAIVEKSRGTQLSIMSTRIEYLCWRCDRDLIDAQRQSGTALMPDELPTR
jgi:DNA-directed RNA polymerase subunit RPC12/RpoP